MSPMFSLALVMVAAGPVQLESLDLDRWTTTLANPKTRCRALAEIGFQDSEWKCLRAGAGEKQRVAVVNRYVLAPGVELICAGPRTHQCDQLVALRDGKRVPLFVPELPAPVSRYRFQPGRPLRVSMLQQFDCRRLHGELLNCPLESPAGTVELTERGVEFTHASWRTREEPGPWVWPASDAPLRLMRARSVGEAKGEPLWRGDTLCLKGTTTRCYDGARDRWAQARGELTEGVTVSTEVTSVDGHAVKFEPAFRPECGGFRELTIDEHTWELGELDVDRMLPRADSEYPSRAVTQLVMSPSGRTGVAFVPRFERRPESLPGTVRCDDGNFGDWQVVAHELYFFENPSAQ